MSETAPSVRDNTVSAPLVGAVVFASSFAVMTLELAASRLYMPHFGSSIFVWGTLISVVLVAMSFGYVVGGRAADRRPADRVLAALLLGSGAWVAVVGFVAPFLLSHSAPLGVVWGTLLGTLVMFLAPLGALGAMTPCVLKLKISDTETVGRTSGNVFFLSSLGSVLGTVATTFLFVPFLGTIRTVGLVAIILVTLGLCMAGRRRLSGLVGAVAGAAAIVLIVAPPALVPAVEGQRFAAESPYQFVRVVEREGNRFLLLNRDRPFESFNSVQTGDLLSGFYFDELALAPALSRGGGQGAPRVLVLGMGAGTVVKTMLEVYPRAVIDGVELDPVVVDVAQREFGLMPSERLRVHTAGGRAWLAASDERWDAIIVDVFQNGPYIPFHFSTREFYELLGEHLTPGGVVAVNVEIVEEPLLNSIAAGLPHVLTVRRRANVVTFASNDPLQVPAVGQAPAALREVMAAAVRDARPFQGAPEPVFTDDRAPVELTIALHEL